MTRDGLTKSDLAKIEKYLRNTFQLQAIEVRPRPKKQDSADVYIADEYAGVIYLIDDDEDEPYCEFRVQILELDLA